MGQSKNWLVILFLTGLFITGSFLLWPALGPKGDPKYCRVLFGPEAETEILVGATADRLLLYLDGNLESLPQEYQLRNESLPEGTEIEIHGANGTVYLITGVSFYREDAPVLRESLMINVTVQGANSFKQYCDVALTESKEALKQAHFDGPLTVGSKKIDWKDSDGYSLSIGSKPTEINAVIGTFDEAVGCWTVVRTHEGEESAFPEGVHPQVEVEYQSKASGEPIREQYFLDQFC